MTSLFSRLQKLNRKLWIFGASVWFWLVVLAVVANLILAVLGIAP